MSKDVCPPSLMADFYKLSHRVQYPKGTETVFATWIPRSNKHYPSCDKLVVFGIQGMIKKMIIDYFDINFFAESKTLAVGAYVRYCKYALNDPDPYYKHIEELHDLGYMPLEICSLPEGLRVPMRIPIMTVKNTDKRFFWLTNFVETLCSSEGWLAPTAATIANRYRTILDYYAEQTGGNLPFVPFQGHDFSMRGMGCVEAAMLSGSGHLLSFVGTDTIPAIAYLEYYYNANIEKELVGTSIPATEHSVMCAGSRQGEFETYKRLITEVYPSGFLSIVSDTWDLWECLEGIIKPLKDDILARDGKIIIRPDSGDPVDIICGDLSYEPGTPQFKGVIEILWDIFGGICNEKGFKELDSHIGAIYGDSITPERCTEICIRLMEKGFASTNCVYGIGSYTYQYNTRDTFGFAMKSTAVVINGKEQAIFKDPITDDGTKKSLTGGVAVQYNDSNTIICIDDLPIDHNNTTLLNTVFRNGELLLDDSLMEIRERLRTQII